MTSSTLKWVVAVICLTIVLLFGRPQGTELWVIIAGLLGAAAWAWDMGREVLSLIRKGGR